MSIGSRVRDFRLEKGLTQKQLGDLCGMADSAIRRYESDRGNPTEKTLKRIASALGVSLIDLMDISSEELEEMEDIAERAARDGRVSKEDVMRVQIESKIAMLPYERLNAIEDAADTALIEQYKGISDDQLHSMCEESFQYLNRLGRIEAARRMDELTEIPKYQKAETPTDGD